MHLVFRELYEPYKYVFQPPNYAQPGADFEGGEGSEPNV